jgi:hypothetical protein
LSDIFGGIIDPKYVENYSYIELCLLIEKETYDRDLTTYILYFEQIQKKIDFEIAEIKKEIQKVKTEINFSNMIKFKK